MSWLARSLARTGSLLLRRPTAPLAAAAVGGPVSAPNVVAGVRSMALLARRAVLPGAPALPVGPAAAAAGAAGQPPARGLAMVRIGSGGKSARYKARLKVRRGLAPASCAAVPV